MAGAPEQYRMFGIPLLTISYPIPPPAVINISMSAPTTNVRSHDFILDSFARWDQSREESGEGQWDFAFHIFNPGLYFPHALYVVLKVTRAIAGEGTGSLSASRARLHKVRPTIQHLQNICVPTSALSPRPHDYPTSARRIGRHDLSQGEDVTSEVDVYNDALQDWNEKASVYFEWVGMVNIGAQRYS